MKTIRQCMLVLTLAVSGLTLAPDAASAQRKQGIITREDISGSSQKDGNVFDLIRGLRPQFFQKPRGTKSIRGGNEAIAIYVDGIKEVDAESLKLINANQVLEVRYYDPAKAQDEFGHGNGAGGAIVVKKIKDGAAPPPAPKDTTKPPTS